MIQEEILGYRLSPQQRRVWTLGETGRRLRSTALVEVEGGVEPERLREALDAVVDAHPSLRTRVFEPAGYHEPVQVVDPRGKVAFSEVAGRAADPEARRLEIARLVEERARRPFDLDRGPLLRAFLVRSSGGPHALFLEAPALAADFHSFSRIVRSLATHLAGGAVAPTAAGDDDAISHLQFCEWQNELSEEAEAAGGIGRGPGQPPEGARRSLPFGRRPRRGSAAGPDEGWVPWPLAAGLASRLERFAEDAGLPVEAVLVAAFAALLGRHVEDDDIEVRCLFDGRKFEELDGTVGPIARHLPVALQPAPGVPFAQWVEEVAAALEEAGERQEYPPREAGTGTGAPAEPSDYGFEFCRAPARFEVAGGALTVVEQRAAVDRFRLHLSVVRLGDRWQTGFGYDPGTFERRDVERLAARLDALLADALARRRAPLLDLELVEREERRVLARAARGDRVPVQGPPLLHRRFEHQAASTPDAVALAWDGRSLTYRELDRRAEGLAGALRAQGAGPGTVVAVHLERSPELVAALLAALKAGAAYLPLDLLYPRRRLEAMLRSSGSRWLVTRGRYAESLAAGEARVLDLDQGSPAPEAGPPTAAEADPRDLAYILYTSGSTGEPKGVMVSHSALSNYVVWAAAAYAPRSGRGVPVHTPVGFDLTVTSLLVPLSSGGTARLLPEESAVETLARELREGEPSSLVKLTPSHLDLLGQLWNGAGPSAPPGVLVVGGEALRAESLAPWRSPAPGAEVVNEYGPTEATVGCAAYRFRAGNRESGPVPLGEPIANAELHLSSPGLRAVPDGLAGEILIGGDGLARGYLGRPAATAERFVPHPFGDRPGDRLYRSGDLARRGDDGALEFLGRVDRQLKVRGFRVEPGEVEAVLGCCPGVAEAAVVVRDDLPGGPALVALVVESRNGPALGDLRELLRDQLPEPLIPASVVRVSHLPLTVHGKLDRRALAELAPAGQERRRPYVRPRSAVQLEIVRIWEELLGLRPIGIEDDFFEIGGHSLLGVRMLARIEQRLGSVLPLSSLLTAGATVRRLASAVERAGRRAPWSPLVAIQPGGSEPPLFLVHPHGGGVLCYLALARALGPDQPVYGLEARGYEPGEEPLDRVEAMAERYLEAVRAVQPQGPYALGGWSFGGVVAFEMARRLAARGERVDPLAVIDSDFRRQVPMDNAEFLVEQLGDGLDLDLEALRRLDEDALLEAAARRAREKGLLSDDLDLERLRRLFRLHKRTYDAAGAYRPAPHHGRTVLFLSSQWLADRPADPTFGLADLAACGLEVHVLPFAHTELVQDPPVRVLAARLGAALARRRAGTREVPA